LADIAGIGSIAFEVSRSGLVNAQPDRNHERGCSSRTFPPMGQFSRRSPGCNQRKRQFATFPFRGISATVINC